MLTSSAQSGMPWLYTNLPFDPVKDFAGVSPFAELPSVLVVPLSRNWASLKELVSAAKALPGALNFSSGGVGSGTPLSSEKVVLAAGISATHVPFKGTPEAILEVIRGRIDWIYTPAASVVSLLKDGKLKGQIFSSKARLEQLPDMPHRGRSGRAGRAAIPDAACGVRCLPCE